MGTADHAEHLHCKRPSWACAKKRGGRGGVGRGARRSSSSELCAGSLGGTGRDSGADPTKSLGVVDVGSILHATHTHRRRVRNRPTVGQEIKQVRGIRNRPAEHVFLFVLSWNLSSG